MICFYIISFSNIPRIFLHFKMMAHCKKWYCGKPCFSSFQFIQLNWINLQQKLHWFELPKISLSNQKTSWPPELGGPGPWTWPFSTTSFFFLFWNIFFCFLNWLISLLWLAPFLLELELVWLFVFIFETNLVKMTNCEAVSCRKERRRLLQQVVHLAGFLDLNYD